MFADDKGDRINRSLRLGRLDLNWRNATRLPTYLTCLAAAHVAQKNHQIEIDPGLARQTISARRKRQVISLYHRALGPSLEHATTRRVLLLLSTNRVSWFG